MLANERADMTPRFPESVFIWLSLVGNAVPPPRDPNDEDADEDEEDEEDEGEPRTRSHQRTRRRRIGKSWAKPQRSRPCGLAFYLRRFAPSNGQAREAPAPRPLHLDEQPVTSKTQL